MTAKPIGPLGAEDEVAVEVGGRGVACRESRMATVSTAGQRCSI